MLMRLAGLAVVAGIALELAASAAIAEELGWGRAWEDIRSDYREFYEFENLRWVYGGVVAGALLANTDVDEQVDEWYQEDIRGRASDRLSKLTREFGEGLITVPVFAAAVAAPLLLPDYELAPLAGEWGERCLRSLLVGLPPMFLIQQVTSHTRPIADKNEGWGSDDNKGVSGHAFMGAVPFVTAAKMSESIPVKAACYAASFLSGISRINDEGHYLSHVLLGWGLAYWSASAVDRTESTRQPVAMFSGFSGPYATLGVRIDF